MNYIIEATDTLTRGEIKSAEVLAQLAIAQAIENHTSALIHMYNKEEMTV